MPKLSTKVSKPKKDRHKVVELTSMPIADRVALHNENYVPTVVMTGKDYFFGEWMVGNRFGSNNGYYGSYDATYVDRVMSMFPDCARKMHLFSGGIPGIPEDSDWYTFDVNPKNKPTWCGDAEKLSEVIPKGLLDPANLEKGPCRHAKFDIILADPPWSKEHCAKYFKMLPPDVQMRMGGKPRMPNRKKVVHECAKLVQPNGFLVWLDVQTPIFTNEEWQWVGSIYIFRSTNMWTRKVSIFRRRNQLELFKP